MNSSELLFRSARDSKSFPSSGIFARPGILLRLSVTRLSRRPTITRLWPFSSSTSVCTFAGVQSRYGKTTHRKSICRIERADLWLDHQADCSARRNRRQKIQTNAEFPELNRDLSDSGSTSLQGRIGKLPTSEKARLVPTERQQVRFGQYLCQIIRDQELQVSPEFRSGRHKNKFRGLGTVDA